jgi:hypothetical protein
MVADGAGSPDRRPCFGVQSRPPHVSSLSTPLIFTPLHSHHSSPPSINPILYLLTLTSPLDATDLLGFAEMPPARISEPDGMTSGKPCLGGEATSDAAPHLHPPTPQAPPKRASHSPTSTPPPPTSAGAPQMRRSPATPPRQLRASGQAAPNALFFGPAHPRPPPPTGPAIVPARLRSTPLR